jgi:hypothetical protein
LFSDDAIGASEHSLAPHFQHGRHERIEEGSAIASEGGHHGLRPRVVVQILVRRHHSAPNYQVHVIRRIKLVRRLRVQKRLQVERREVRRRPIPRAERLQLRPERCIRKRSVQRRIIPVRKTRAMNLPNRMRPSKKKKKKKKKLFSHHNTPKNAKKMQKK